MLVLMMIEDMLADLGCESVTTAATTDKAITLIGSQVFDAAMLDVNLNGKTSRAVADVLAARGVPFLFSTGYSGDAMSDGHRERAVLKKPFKYEELAEALRRLLDAAQT